MKLLDILRDKFFPPSGLRNKAGGMAWINSNANEGGGTEVLVGRVVRTVRVRHGGFWAVDPPQTWTATTNVTFVSEPGGPTAQVGAIVTVGSFADYCLTPMRDPDYKARDESLHYLPPVPTHKPVKEPA